MDVSYATMIAIGTLVQRLGRDARRLEKALAETMNASAEWRRIVDELKAERDAERKAHDEYKERNREIFNGNQRLTAELAVIKDERDALRAECDDLENAIDALKKRRWLRMVDQYLHPLRPSHGSQVESSQEEVMQRREKDCAQKDQEVRQAEEATHDTPEGKAAAEGALPKPGDVVRLVREPTADTVGDTLRKSLEWPWKSLWGSVGDRGKVVESVGKLPGARSVRIMNTGCTVWWPLSCMEVVKGADK